MLPGNDRLTYLFRRYLQNNTSDEELEELFTCIRKTSHDALLKKRITEVFQQVESQEGTDRVDWDTMFSRIIDNAAMEMKELPLRKKKLPLWRSVAAALVIFILGGASAYVCFDHTPSPDDIAQSEAVQNDIMPGGNKATLTLSNGAKVILDSMHKGKLVNYGKVNVIKTGSGMLAYRNQETPRENSGHSASTAPEPPTVPYNTLTTPRGGQYRLTLSDGTNVWLNAASSIRYPITFTGKERKVAITGEAYFEVAHNERKPFKVQAGKVLIEDLGTHFNINAFSDEPDVKTTLLEGSVKVGGALLQPGEQAVSKKNGQLSVVKNADLEDVVSWKNGFFAFNNANLQTIMRKLSRWYNIEVVYKPGVNNEQRFSGRIDRSLTLTQVLNGLKQTRANFRIEANRKVVILR
ncbi:MAG TPA: FecR domain-containing protein [Chitinophagaceae bacterium]|nr:FecR domain-containing protein [Chitinophagaceae bacterium]